MIFLRRKSYHVQSQKGPYLSSGGGGVDGFSGNES
jgi:hypothetical protein